MKKIIIFIVVVIVIICFLPQKTDTAVKIDPIKVTEVEPLKPKALEPEFIKSVQSKYYVKPANVPDDFKGFYNMKGGEQLKLITSKMNNKRLDKRTINFLKAEVFNRTLDDTTRNNMANALIWQTHADPELHKLFIMMAADDDEKPVWRDYSIQFMSESYDSSNDKALIIEAFKHHSRGSDSIAGTALVHLALHEKLNGVDLGPDFSNQMVAQLEDFNTSIHTKTSILAIIGQRGDKSQLPVVREYAKQDDNAALKSVAIGTLGLIGDVSDIPVIKAALSHKNGRVVLAAKAALKRINERTKDYESLKKAASEFSEAMKTKPKSNTGTIPDLLNSDELYEKAKTEK